MRGGLGPCAAAVALIATGWALPPSLESPGVVEATGGRGGALLGRDRDASASTTLSRLARAAQASAQRPRRRSAPAPAVKTEPASVTCPAVLGLGVATGRRFCDVLLERDPRAGILVQIPPHRGTATLAFDLHNRHLYSETEIRAGRAYASYTAIVGVFAPDGTRLASGVVRSEFRTARDLLDRIAGGAGPAGVKAVAPLGVERVLVEVPPEILQVFIVGERLEVVRRDGRDTYLTPGQPIAAVSQVEVEYRPAPPPRGRRPGRPRQSRADRPRVGAHGTREAQRCAGKRDAARARGEPHRHAGSPYEEERT